MLATNAGRDLNHDGVPDVPSLANATVILNAFSSDAAYWGVFAADRLAAEAQSIAGPEVDVRLLIDGFFPAALDNEGRYSAGAPSPFNLLADGYSTTGLCGPLPDNLDGVANEVCSDARYLPGQPLPDVTTSIFAAMKANEERKAKLTEDIGRIDRAMADSLQGSVHFIRVQAEVID